MENQSLEKIFKKSKSEKKFSLKTVMEPHGSITHCYVSLRLNMKKTFSFISLLLFLVSCSTGVYVDQAIDLSQTATYSKISTDSDLDSKLLGLNHAVVFTKHNGMKLPNHLYGGPMELNVLSGLHQIDITYHYLGSATQACMKFETKPGTNYVVRRVQIDGKTGFLIQDSNGDLINANC